MTTADRIYAAAPESDTVLHLLSYAPVEDKEVVLNFSAFVVVLSGTGYTSVSFGYAYVDSDEETGPPVSYTISWTSLLPVGLVSFDVKNRNYALPKRFFHSYLTMRLIVYLFYLC